MTNAIPFAQRFSCSIDEACQATGIGRTKIYQEIATGRVRTVTIGRRRLVLIASLKRFVQGEEDGQRG